MDTGCPEPRPGHRHPSHRDIEEPARRHTKLPGAGTRAPAPGPSCLLVRELLDDRRAQFADEELLPGEGGLVEVGVVVLRDVVLG